MRRKKKKPYSMDQIKLRMWQKIRIKIRTNALTNWKKVLFYKDLKLAKRKSKRMRKNRCLIKSKKKKSQKKRKRRKKKRKRCLSSNLTLRRRIVREIRSLNHIVHSVAVEGKHSSKRRANSRLTLMMTKWKQINRSFIRAQLRQDCHL